MAQNPNPSHLDHQQILQRVFDAANDALRTDATIQVDTLNANLTVDIKAADGDNIAIANANGSLVTTITTNGSKNGLDVNVINTSPIPVVVTNGASGTVKNYYNEITSVGAGNLTTISTYTVPSGHTSSLLKYVFNGSTIATYTILFNNIVIDKKYTMWGSSFYGDFEFINGLPLISGDVIIVKVIHQQGALNSFNGRIQVIEV
jgi:hypothetical protein